VREYQPQSLRGEMSQVVKGLLGSFSTARHFEKTEQPEKIN
jgi:hypothetical protein